MSLVDGLELTETYYVTAPHHIGGVENTEGMIYAEQINEEWELHAESEDYLVEAEDERQTQLEFLRAAIASLGHQGVLAEVSVKCRKEYHYEPLKPDAAGAIPCPEYLQSLLLRSRLSKRKAAKLIGISERTLHYYLSEIGSETYRPAPYSVQFCLEALCRDGFTYTR